VSRQPIEHGFTVFCGLDVAKADHHVVALDRDGRRIIDRRIANDESALAALFAQAIDVAGTARRVPVVVDQPASIGALPVAVARAHGIPVGYLPGLAPDDATTVDLHLVRRTPETPIYQGLSLPFNLQLDQFMSWSRPRDIRCGQ
jgi:hypothetical protein